MPSGRYKETVMGGDPDYADSKYSFSIEGVDAKENLVVLCRKPVNKQDFPTGIATAEVYDGKLTVMLGAGIENVKISNLIVEQVYCYIPSNGDTQINFGSDKEAPYYLNDLGDAFGNRGGGKSYGWSRDLTSSAVVRNSVSEPVLQSFVPMESNSWEMELANGEYIVGLSCGDADDWASEHQFEFEGVVCPTRFVPTSECKWGTIQDTVTVTDGRLTIKAAPIAVNAKINAVHISKLPIPQMPSIGELNQLVVGMAAVELPLSSNSSNPFTIESSNPAVISVVDGNLHVNGAGDATIMVTQHASAGFLSGSTSAALHVYPNAQVKPFADFIGVNGQKDGTLFVDKTIGSPTSWNWTFEGAVPATSSVQNPEVFYVSPGTYKVSLTATNALGTSTQERAGYVTVSKGTADLALNRPVSSTPLEYAYQNLEHEAVDGDDQTKWAGAMPNSILTVDLQQMRAISDISILWGEDYAKSFTIEMSDDNENWLEVKSISNQTLEPNAENRYPQPIVTLTNAVGRYVRVNCAVSNTAKCFSIHSLVVTGLDCALTPIARPTAAFDFTKEDDEVCFTNRSSADATAWEWSIPALSDTVIFAENPIVVFGTSGIKSVTLVAINASGRSEKVTKSFEVTTGLFESGDSKLRVYPNPAKDQITIERSNSNQEVVSLFNSLGVLQKSVIIDQPQMKIDLSALPAGVYLLSFKSERVNCKVVKTN